MKKVQALNLFMNLGGDNVSFVVPMYTRKDGVISETTGTATCREIGIGNFASKLCYKPIGGKKPQEFYDKKLAFMTQKARVIFYKLNKTQFDALDSGKALNVIHIVEDAAGIPRTQVREVCVEGYPTPKYKVMFVSHNRWIRSSHTMSLWLMLLRLGFREASLRNKKVKDFKSLKEAMKDYPTNSCGTNASAVRDRYFAKKTINNWLPLMKNLDKIFPPNTPWRIRFNAAKVHKKSTGGGPYTGSIGTEGIFKLATKKASHKNAQRFYELVSKKGK